MSNMGDMEDIEPVRAVPDDRAYVRREWAKFTDGEWWQFRNAPDHVLTADAYKNNLIRVAARKWAARHGYSVETRTARRGKELFIRFAKH